jgi:hypothetical protein
MTQSLLIDQSITDKRIEEDAEVLCDFLQGRGWMKAQAIAFEFPQWLDRHIRKLAAASGGRIVSGQLGYKLTIECTPEEAGHAQSWLRSQARQMIARSIQISKTFHKAVHQPA